MHPVDLATVYASELICDLPTTNHGVGGTGVEAPVNCPGAGLTYDRSLRVHEEPPSSLYIAGDAVTSADALVNAGSENTCFGEILCVD